MKNKSVQTTGSNQLRWVILLLAVAVILPTVCLLWFMTQAIKNERLAVRQKLIDVCSNNVNAFKADFDRTFRALKTEDLRRIEWLIDNDNIWLWTNAVKADADGLVVYDADNRLVYPARSDYQGSVFSDEIQNAFKLEQNRDYQKALDEYRIIMDSNDAAIFPATMGIIRCLEKLDLVTETADFFHKLLWSDDRGIRMKFTPDQVAMIRVKKHQWLAEHKDTFTDGGMSGGLQAWYTDMEYYPAEVTIWALEKMIKFAGKFGDRPDLAKAIQSAQETIKTETISLAAAVFFNTEQSVENWPIEKWRTIRAKDPLYTFMYRVDESKVLLIRTQENMRQWTKENLGETPIKGVYMRLLDGTGESVYGPNPKIDVRPFISIGFNEHFPGWKLEFYFKGDGVFDSVAERQVDIYTWTAILVVLLIFATGAIATQALSRQIKLNRLKNDFIATVTHELKTPLSSMRVLVDTLLDGSYNDQKQAGEYLQLISKENLRLSRLIDNFLTFSRMERNKQAFDIVKVDPSEIAEAAADAMQTKFDIENCEFSVTIDDNLPIIMADKDAMVTVLVNLLDNAYKYSLQNKRIELTVFAQEGKVCFSVKDNGIAMTRRQIKRIFDRFYQADNSLARSAEGTGLGLSIVKFIVDAHKGQIDVESKPGQGSDFTITVPFA